MVIHPQSNSVKARDLCTRLKPLIGTQADKIWLAYLGEDVKGRVQIEEYLELLFAQHFQMTLDSKGPGLVPPKSEDAFGEYCLGQVSYNGKDLFPFGLRENEWCQHVGIYGRSGAGKTNIGFLLVQELLKKNKPILILDWKRNYRDLLPLQGFENLAVYTIGRNTAPLCFNPLIPPAGTDPRIWMQKLIGILCLSHLLGDGVAFVLQEAIDDVYEASGVYTGHISRWPTFRDVFETLKRRDTAGREAGWMSSALRAVASLCFGPMDLTINQGHEDIARIFERPVVLELDALDQPSKTFVCQYLCLWVLHDRMTKPVREEFRSIILIEEAHHLLSHERKSLLGGESVFESIFRMIREFGIGIVCIDQMPSQISMPALANTYATICFNLKHRADTGTMSQCMLLKDEEKDILGNLQIGEAVVRLQGRGTSPFLIQVPEFHIQKGKVSDPDLTHHMIKLGFMGVRDQPQAPKQDFSPALTELAFLRDVERYDGGIAERYKRLGLSVRQGQRVKDSLLQKGLVRESMEELHNRNLKVVRITEQGKRALDSAFEPT